MTKYPVIRLSFTTSHSARIAGKGALLRVTTIEFLDLKAGLSKINAQTTDAVTRSGEVFCAALASQGLRQWLLFKKQTWIKFWERWLIWKARFYVLWLLRWPPTAIQLKICWQTASGASHNVESEMQARELRENFRIARDFSFIPLKPT
ncbi:hypothetical protein BH11PAT2_BH11PAT2_02940 [soil metagenome]